MKNFILAFILLISLHTKAQLRLPALLGDSMVLQQKSSVPIWGWAAAGQKVSVTPSWSGEFVQTTADKEGKWMVHLNTPDAGGPYKLTVISNRNQILLQGILLGEVWLCAGQSNMEMPLSGFPNDPISQSATEIANAKYPSIRFFAVNRKIAFKPETDVKGTWESCTPASAAAFSAVAYFFGRNLFSKLDVPIGLIDASWGGTVAEAWTSEGALSKMVDFDNGLKLVNQMANNFKSIQLKDSLNQQKWNKAIKANYSGILNDNNLSAWKRMQVPSVWESYGLNIDGIVWFKQQVSIPNKWMGKKLTLELGPIDDMDETYINGKLVGKTLQDGAWQLNRKYSVPAQIFKPGKNMLAVKVIDNGGGGGIHGVQHQLKLYADGERDTVWLAGNWYYKVAATKPPSSSTTNPNQPTVLYNGMIAPLVPYTIKGAIWYQGESNVGRARQYEKLFSSLIADWRNLWKEPDFPFYYVQIAPYRYGGSGFASAALRDAQRRVLMKLPNVGMAVTLDIGDAGNIHPSNKQEVGKRLAFWALNKTYNFNNTNYSGPLYIGFKEDGSKVTVSFTHTEGGLTSNDKPLAGFEILDRNGKWYPADAVIDEDKVILVNNSVSAAIGVRYAYSDISEASLFNGKGFPASSFTSEELR